MSFSSRLLQWYHKHQRDLPWRQSSDPYRVWLSEIILQQTRIAQGYEYYLRFLEKFPDVHALAAASEDEVLALWQGLGYYSRARNLHFTARMIVNDYKGEFPPTLKGLLKLKGVGAYTAAAIASICFGIPVAAVDGNVLRVMARYFCIQEPVDTSPVTRQINQMANELIDTNQPGIFNQALMDLGATVCKPGKPHCQLCPLADDCQGRALNLQNQLPLKIKKVKVKKRFFHFFHLQKTENGETFLLVEKRRGDDIWKNLYQLPLLESLAEEFSEEELMAHPVMKTISMSSISWAIAGLPKTYRHVLTHQVLMANFYRIEVSENYYPNFGKTFEWVTYPQFQDKAKPILVKRFLDETCISTANSKMSGND